MDYLGELETFILLCGKYNRDNMYNRPDFVDDVTKHFGVFFQFTVPTAVHLQNVNAKFYKVEYRHYSGEVENVYTTI